MHQRCERNRERNVSEVDVFISENIRTSHAPSCYIKYARIMPITAELTRYITDVLWCYVGQITYLDCQLNTTAGGNTRRYESNRLTPLSS